MSSPSATAPAARITTSWLPLIVVVLTQMADAQLEDVLSTSTDATPAQIGEALRVNPEDIRDPDDHMPDAGDSVTTLAPPQKD